MRNIFILHLINFYTNFLFSTKQQSWRILFISDQYLIRLHDSCFKILYCSCSENAPTTIDTIPIITQAAGSNMRHKTSAHSLFINKIPLRYFSAHIVSLFLCTFTDLSSFSKKSIDTSKTLDNCNSFSVSGKPWLFSHLLIACLVVPSFSAKSSWDNPFSFLNLKILSNQGVILHIWYDALCQLKGASLNSDTA